MQLCLQRLCTQGLHRSSGLQKAQAIRMTTEARGRKPPPKASSRVAQKMV
jgi:hypothetical protein